MRKLKNWLDAYMIFTERIEPPDGFNQWSGLWALATALNRKTWIPFDYFTVYPNLFTVLVGPPASRKTTAAVIAKNLCKKAGILDDSIDIASKEALLNDLANTKRVFSWRGEDVNYCTTSLVSTEWSTLLGNKDIDFCNLMCKLYDCDDKIKKITKTQGRDDLENVYFNMHGCSTAKQIGEALPHASIGSGFTSRIIFVVEDGPKLLNPWPSMSNHEHKLHRDLIHDLQHISEKMVGPFKKTVGGNALFIDWYVNRKEALSVDEKFQHYCDRKHIHVLKLAMLLSASRTDDMRIGAAEIDAAIKMLARIEPRMPEALGGIGLSASSPIIAAVIQTIRREGKVSREALQRRMWRDANDDELTLALRTIVRGGMGVGVDGQDNFYWIKEGKDGKT